MSKSSIVKARRRLRRERPFNFNRLPRGLLLLLFALIFSVSVLLRGYASHADPFSVNTYFPGWDIRPAVFDPPNAFEQTWASALGPLYQLELGSAKSILNSSVTVALPLTEKSTPTLARTLAGILERPARIEEVVILCPETLLSKARLSLRQILSSYRYTLSTQLTLLPCLQATCSAKALIDTAFHASTDWTLFLGESGLQELNNEIGSLLLNPPDHPHRPADFLVPPFVLPSLTFSDECAFMNKTLDSWLALGRWISSTRPDMIGGVIIGRESAGDSCFASHSDVLNSFDRQHISTLGSGGDHLRILDQSAQFSDIGHYTPHCHFGVLFPTLDDLIAFSQAACGLVINGYHIDILLYAQADTNQTFIATDTCDLYFETSTSAGSTPADSVVSSWLAHLSDPPDVFIALTITDTYTNSLLRAVRSPALVASVLVRLARPDLLYSDWMGTLSVVEWRHWNVPRVDVSIITNNRSRSLSRLLGSLERARYFGDSLDLRFNMEDSADADTKRLADSLGWKHGSVFIHHRIAHGGLLTAVVESWYPQSNDSYGLLLEDDVELSPLFYAWIKLALLRYRYGGTKNKSPRLFGISLYQQKNNELHLEGRRPFDARRLFNSTGMAAENSPYLSQIPCSWGAVYFPEHWREFHSYVASRLTDPSPLFIVPNVRSNRWQHSWKKYFIEMVFLRGYTMLYPNYANFSSLSTNRLEPGAHVKRLPRAIFDKKRAQFDLPIIQLPDVNSSDVIGTGLLDLPEGGMPPWGALPVLDLHGSIVSEGVIVKRGEERRLEIFGCTDPARKHDALSLLCLQ
ncbi:hypothetical protein EDB85DRAFT_2173332 [Lactarius pseudohatsudake]|nr:hypothetical protein EDB85DRAFT_2173332 [Lactarius pseudohatsudake]